MDAQGERVALKSDRRGHFFRAYFECAAQFGSAISTRRFFALPASVALSAIGLVLPKPLAVSRSPAIPCSVSQVTIALARLRERLIVGIAAHVVRVSLDLDLDRGTFLQQIQNLLQHRIAGRLKRGLRSEEHTSELQ